MADEPIIDAIRVTLKHGILLIDRQDEPLLSQYNWFSYANGYTFYVKATKGKFTVRIHRLIMDAPPYQQVDHKNRNGLDNRRENLRISDRYLNLLNRRLFHTNRSGFRGVSYDADAQRWVAHIKQHGIQTNLGRFDTPEEAARRWDAEALRLRGDHAQLNFSPHPRSHDAP